MIVDPNDRPKAQIGGKWRKKVFVKRGKGEGQVYALYDFVFVRDGLCMCKKRRGENLRFNEEKKKRCRAGSVCLMSLMGYISAYRNLVSRLTHLCRGSKAHRVEAPKSSVPWGLRAHED